MNRNRHPKKLDRLRLSQPYEKKRVRNRRTYYRRRDAVVAVVLSVVLFVMLLTGIFLNCCMTVW